MTGRVLMFLNTAGLFQQTVATKNPCFLKIALKMQVVPDTDPALWRKLSKCITSTDEPGSLLNIVAYIQHTGGTKITYCALSEWYYISATCQRKRMGALVRTGFFSS